MYRNVTQKLLQILLSEQVCFMFSQSTTQSCWHPFMNNCIGMLHAWAYAQNITIGPIEQPPLVTPAVTGEQQSSQHESVSMFPLSEIPVSVVDVHLHLPGAASSTASLLSSLPPSTLLCELYVVMSTTWCEYWRILCINLNLNKNTHRRQLLS